MTGIMFTWHSFLSSEEEYEDTGVEGGNVTDERPTSDSECSCLQIEYRAAFAIRVFSDETSFKYPETVASHLRMLSVFQSSTNSRRTGTRR